MIKKVFTYKDDVLRKKCKNVKKETDVPNLIEDLFNTTAQY